MIHHLSVQYSYQSYITSLGLKLIYDNKTKVILAAEIIQLKLNYNTFAWIITRVQWIDNNIKFQDISGYFKISLQTQFTHPKRDSVGG